MSYRPLYQTILLCLVLCVSSALWAKGPFLDEYDEDLDITDPEAWKESAATLPAYPNDDDLLEFPVEEDTGAKLRYFIDSKTLTIGDDGIVRYVLVIRAGQGAKNVVFEGMHCSTREYKTYAFGTGKETFHSLRKPAWKPIRRNTRTAYHQRLVDHYLCHGEYSVARDRQNIVDAFKYGDLSRDCTLCD